MDWTNMLGAGVSREIRQVLRHVTAGLALHPGMSRDSSSLPRRAARVVAVAASLAGAWPAPAQIRVLEPHLVPVTNTYPFAGYHDRTRGVNVIGDHAGVYGWAGKGLVNRDHFPGNVLVCLCEFPRSPGDLMTYHSTGYGLLRYRDSEWTPVPPTGFDPSGYLNVRLGHDPQRQVTMLYHWNTLGQSETWEFDGATWSRLAQHSGSIEFVTIYHQTRRQRIHGIDRQGGIHEWRPPNWVQIDALPASENVVIQAAAYHTGRQRLAVVGQPTTPSVMRTYEHDGTTYWIYSHTVGPIWTFSTSWSLMVYDEARSECVLFCQDRDLAWAFSGAGWDDLSVPSTKPSPREGAMMANERLLGSVMFGGFEQNGAASAETWVRSDERWTLLNPTTAPPARAWGAMAAWAGATGRLLMFGGMDGNGTPLGDTWELFAGRWSAANTAGAPSARLNHAMAYDAVAARTYLFGGTTHSQWFGDFYAAQLGSGGPQWSALPSGPPARDIHAMAVDLPRRRLVLFGGRDAAGAEFADTWEFALDTNQWQRRQPQNSPRARVNHTMVYDEARARTVLLGGYTWTAGYLDDIWEWDGSDWTQRIPETRGIEPTEDFAAAYDARSRRIVAFGGRSAFGGPPSGRTFELYEPSGEVVAQQSAPLALRTLALPLVGVGRSPLELMVPNASGATALLLTGGRPAAPVLVGGPPLWCRAQSLYVLPMLTLAGAGSPPRFSIPVPASAAGALVSYQAIALTQAGCIDASEARFALVRSSL
jgi:hypothetical protein